MLYVVWVFGLELGRKQVGPKTKKVLAINFRLQGGLCSLHGVCFGRDLSRDAPLTHSFPLKSLSQFKHLRTKVTQQEPDLMTKFVHIKFAILLLTEENTRCGK